MHDILLLQDLAVVIIAAALATIAFRQFKQPVVLGYILAGFLIGPHTPPFSLIADEHTIETLSQLGVIFLMSSPEASFSQTSRIIGPLLHFFYPSITPDAEALIQVADQHGYSTRSALIGSSRAARAAG